MNILDYETPQKPAVVNWLRRYLLFVPLIIIGHLCLFWAVTNANNWVGERISVVIEGIAAFPLFFLAGPDFSLDQMGLYSVIDAAIWGFGAVGIWHGISLWRRCRRPHF